MGKWILGTETVQGARKALPSSEGASRRSVQSGHVGHQSAQQKRRPVCSTQATTGCDRALAFNVAEMQTIFVSRTILIHLGHQRRIEVTDGCPVGPRSLPNRGGQSRQSSATAGVASGPFPQDHDCDRLSYSGRRDDGCGGGSSSEGSAARRRGR
jgi:hypothetical protein